MNSVEWDTLEWAKQYASLGWRTIPIRPGTKVPSMRAWQNVATNDPEVLRKWFGGLYDKAGIGVATGQSSQVWVLDVDPGHGGKESLKALVALHKPLPKGPKVDTPSGGFHLYFRNPEGVHVATTKNIGQLNGHPSGLDVRGDGGQVLAPPSVHPNGLPYMWTERRDPWEIELPIAPDWLLELVVPELAPKPETPAALPLVPEMLEYSSKDASAAEAITAAYQWHQLLESDGWSQAGTSANGDTTWTRPGKDKRLGISAILHEPEGPLVNYSTEARALCQPWARNDASDCWSYSIFGYLAATKFNGDRSAIAADWRAERTASQVSDWAATATEAVPHPEPEFESDDSLDFAHLLVWSDFWQREHNAEQWAMWPLIPAGRSIALYAPAKAGKSTVVLAGVVAAACGQAVFGTWDTEPVDVLYLDYEMTENDIFERLSDLGYGPEIDMSHLHYSMLPSIFPLDTKEGAQQIVRLAEHVNAKIVVIDTFSRAVKGEENDADTSRDFYRFTGMALKSRGIACLRTDHAGKDSGAGQRGSSAKNDDVDVVWSLEKSDSGVKITRTHSRITWVPEQVAIEQVEHDDGQTTYKITQRRQWPTGIPELAAVMDLLKIGLKASYREAGKALREGGEAASNSRIRLAQQFREINGLTDWAPKVSDDLNRII